MSEVGQFEEIRDKLTEQYPERCRVYGLCGSLALQVTHWAIGVTEGSMTLDDAAAAAETDAAKVAQDCRYGQSLRRGDPPYPVCNRGVLCRFP